MILSYYFIRGGKDVYGCTTCGAESPQIETLEHTGDCGEREEMERYVQNRIRVEKAVDEAYERNR